MNRYYLTAEQTGQRDVAPRPFFIEDRAGDRSWLEHEHLPWQEGVWPEEEHLPYRGHGPVAQDYPVADLYDDYPDARHSRRPPGRYEARQAPPAHGGWGPSWPGEALQEFFGFGRGRRDRRPDAHPDAYRTESYAGPNHRGRGPRGYQRSDERIVEEICERLSDDPLIDASDITVRSDGGSVVLEGSVDSRVVKHRVEDIVDDCVGVAGIQNRLKVDRLRAHGTGDSPLLR